MSEKPVHATAKVELLIEISLTDTWGENCQLDQIFKQGTDGALGLLRHANLLKEAIDQGRVKIIGQPIVKAIVTERKL